MRKAKDTLLEEVELDRYDRADALEVPVAGQELKAGVQRRNCDREIDQLGLESAPGQGEAMVRYARPEGVGVSDPIEAVEELP